MRTVMAIPGDVDIDSQITEADRSMLSDFLLQKISLAGTALSNADANLDGQVDIADLLQVSITLSTIFHIRSIDSFTVTPGQVLSINGGGFDPASKVWVQFLGSNSSSHDIFSSNRIQTSLNVRVPPHIDFSSWIEQQGTVSVRLRKRITLSTNELSNEIAGLQISALSQTGLTPGTITMQVMTNIEQLIADTKRNWQAIDTAAEGNLVGVDSFLATVTTLKGQVASSRTLLEPLVNGNVSQIFIGNKDGAGTGPAIFLDTDSLMLLDKMFVAYHLVDRNIGTTALAEIRPFGPADDPINCPDITTCFRDEHNLTLAQTMAQLLGKFTKFQEIGESIIGETKEVAEQIGVPQTITDKASSTAGAVLYYAGTVAPSVMGASMYSFSAPFIEMDLGRPATPADYQPFLDHMNQGSKDFLGDQDGIFPLAVLFLNMQGQSDIGSLLLDSLTSADDAFHVLDMTDANSVMNGAFALSSTIYDNVFGPTPTPTATPTQTPIPSPTPTPTTVPPTPTPVVGGAETWSGPFSGNLTALDPCGLGCTAFPARWSLSGSMNVTSSVPVATSPPSFGATGSGSGQATVAQQPPDCEPLFTCTISNEPIAFSIGPTGTRSGNTVTITITYEGTSSQVTGALSGNTITGNFSISPQPGVNLSASYTLNKQ